MSEEITQKLDDQETIRQNLISDESDIKMLLTDYLERQPDKTRPFNFDFVDADQSFVKGSTRKHIEEVAKGLKFTAQLSTSFFKLVKNADYGTIHLERG